VDAGKGVTVCDLGVFADEATETVSPQNTHAAHLYGWMDAPGGRTLLQRPVRPMSVVMVGVLREGTAGTAARPAGVMRPGSCLTDAERSKEARMLRALLENREQAMLGRDRRHERREERREARRDGPEVTRYQMRQRMISIGDDYVIENDRGQRVFKLDGKALRVRKTIVFEDMDGRELCKIQERMLRVKDSMEIEDPGGHRMALVQKAMITPVRERWSVKVEGAPDLRVQGNIVDHEYAIEREGQRVAEVSKRWFRVRDTYGVEVAPGENDVLVLATAAVIDTMAHPDR
jgi:uncharacterized protein YxjI